MNFVTVKFYLIALLLPFVTSNGLDCSAPTPDVPKDWIDIKKTCTQKIRNQITLELKAAMQYMAMGAHFNRESVNLPGFADLFFEAASEERQHAIKLISYLLMRGELSTNVSNLIRRNLFPATTSWSNGVSALKEALKLEAFVTRNIRSVMVECEQSEGFNDYHLVDFLTADFLNEQYHGQRDFAGKIASLDKMMRDHGELGEWLFDKRLLKKDV